MKNLSKNLVRAMVALSFVALFSMSVPAYADEWLDTEDLYSSDLACPNLSSSGEIIHEYNGRLRKVATRISFQRWGEVSVTVNGVAQKADRIRVRDLSNGRKLVTLLFRRPAVLGGTGSALLSGTVFHRGHDATFYGNIYFNSKATHETICDSDHWYDSHEFGWDYIGKFEYRNF
ncbi:MAG: hypothetical protein KDD39_10630 [Bdellovibrionales bacterium]|nr:hypothetical protein [Bdellovibrionales bacterium]